MPITAPPHHDVNDQRPRVLEHFVGQRNVVERIRVALESSWRDGVRLPHMLFTGGGGLGKTQLCEVVAREMGCELIQQLGQNLNSPSAISAFLLEGEHRNILGIDEIHMLLPAAQTALYRALEEQCLYLPSCQPGGSSQAINLSNFTLIGATTDQYALLGPLLQRFKIIAYFRKYSPDELSTLLDQRCQMLKWAIDSGVLAAISQRGRGTPRIALRLLEACRRTARAAGDDTISMNTFIATCRLEEVDDAGLDHIERRYLTLLSESPAGTRLNVAAAQLGLPRRTVQKIIELSLLEESFIEKDRNGLRLLTDKGRRHLEK